MIHGWINLNKPLGISSAQAVTQVKKIFGVKKAGHLGTLDPLASGVLPIALGEATKTIPYVSSDLKAYNFTIKWGTQRTTDDLDGGVIRSSTIKPDYNQINCAIKNFVGEITQTPPAFSAVKINGARAYKLSRSGQTVSIKPRLVNIHELKLVSMDTINNSADFSMLCGSGVYVRSIARDLGIALNCFGYVAKLRRTMVGDFKEDESVTIEQLADSLVSLQSTMPPQYNPLSFQCLSFSSSQCLFFPSSQCLTLGSRKEETWMPAEMTMDNAKSFVIPIKSALKTMLRIEISAEDARKIRNGQEIILNNLCNLKNYDICYTIMGNLPIAICSFICGCIKPIRVFNI